MFLVFLFLISQSGLNFDAFFFPSSRWCVRVLVGLTGYKKLIVLGGGAADSASLLLHQDVLNVAATRILFQKLLIDAYLQMLGLDGVILDNYQNGISVEL